MSYTLKSFVFASSDIKLIDQLKNDLNGSTINMEWSGNFIDSLSYIESNSNVDLLLLDLDSTILSGTSAISSWKHLKSSLKKAMKIPPQLLLLSNANNLEECIITRSHTNTEILIKPFHIDHLKAYYEKLICTSMTSEIISPDNEDLNPEITQQISSLSQELESESNINHDLITKRDEIIWKYLRTFKFPNIPLIKQCKEDDNKIGNFQLFEILNTSPIYTKRVALNTDNQMLQYLKVIPKTKLLNIDDIERIDYEISILQNIHHDNIIQLLYVEHTPSYILFVQEYAAGGSLRALVLKNYPLNEDDICRILSQLICAIDYIHTRRICHRYLSPDSILFDDFNNLKLINFENSTKQLPGQYLTDYCNNIGYISPEILTSQQYDGLLCDIFSIGCLLLFMLIGSDDVLMSISQLSDINLINDAMINLLNNEKLTNISPNLTDFLIHTFTIDKEQRLSSSNLMKHPLINKKQAPSTPLHIVVPKTKNFIATPAPLKFRKNPSIYQSKSTPSIISPSQKVKTFISPNCDNSNTPNSDITSPKLKSPSMNKIFTSHESILPLLNVKKYEI